MKPFIKPRPPAAAPAPIPSSPAPPVAPDELAIFALAASIHDPAERAACLDRACGGDNAMRRRIDERLVTRDAQRSNESSMIVRPQPFADSHPAGHAVALVPMTAAQLASATGPAPRANHVPWIAATLLAAAAGALAVLFVLAKNERIRAELAAQDAALASSEAEHNRQRADAAALESKTVAEREKAARLEAERLRETALADAKGAQSAAEKARADLEHERETAKAADELVNRTFAEEIGKSKAQFVEMLGKLASAEFAAKNYFAAATAAQQWLEQRPRPSPVFTNNTRAELPPAENWAVTELRSLLGLALLQIGRTPDAEREILQSAAAVEILGFPAVETDRAAFTNATKRIVQFFNSTGRRREGTEWKRKFDALRTR